MSLRKLTIQPFIFLILFSILQNLGAATFGSSFSGSKKLTTYASSDGVVPILKDSTGFYVNVDIGRPSNPSTNQTQNTTAKMMLILMSNQTTLASSCLNFSPYNCNSYPCSMIQIFNDFYEPWWHANNQLAKAFVSLDPSYWTLSNYAFLAYQCTGNNYNIGTGRYGAIGLGYAKANFLKGVLFSIWIDQNLESGALLFVNDTAKYASSSEIASFPADQYWNIDSLGGSIVIGTKSYSWNGVVGFDINSDLPGFDTNTFNSIVNYIKSYSSGTQVTCSSSAYKPVCNYTGSFDFPDLKIMMRKNAWIPIPSDLIYINKTGSSFTLNMKILSDQLNNANYITPAYVGTVVLNAQIMSRFYIVFNGINQTIHLYNANKSPGTSWEWLYVLIFTLIGLLFIGVLAFFAAKAIMKSDEDMEKPVYINYKQRSPLLNTENSMNQEEDHQVFSGPPNKKNIDKN